MAQKIYSFKTKEDIMTFGLYRGKSIWLIMNTDADYIDWCIKKFKAFKLYKKLNEEFIELKKSKKASNNEKAV